VNPPFCAVGNIGHDAFAHFAGRGGLPFRGEIIPDVGLLVLDARGFGRLQAPDAGPGVFDHDLHGAAGEIPGLRGAIAAEDEQLGDTFGKFFAQGGELLVRGRPDGDDVAVAVGILLLEGDALFEAAVEFGELVGGEPAHAVGETRQDISRGVFAKDLGRFVDFVVGEDHSQLWMSRWRWMPAGHSGVVKLVSAKRT
jgi:hypothetical protein